MLLYKNTKLRRRRSLLETSKIQRGRQGASSKRANGDFPSQGWKILIGWQESGSTEYGRWRCPSTVTLVGQVTKCPQLRANCVNHQPLRPLVGYHILPILLTLPPLSLLISLFLVNRCLKLKRERMARSFTIRLNRLLRDIYSSTVLIITRPLL